MASLLSHRENGVLSSAPPAEPLSGTVISVILAFSALSIISCFLTQRSIAVKSWRRLSLIAILVSTIYIDSWIFVFASGIIDYGIGVDTNLEACSAAILICLFFYVTTKLIYIFLVEKAFIIQGSTKRRFESRLYLFNSFGILTLYAIVCTLAFVYRIARMDNGQCIIGIERSAMIPLITFDAAVNVYLTILFLNPLRSVYSLKARSRASINTPKLRAATIRTFVGALCTTTSSIVNLTVLMVLDGEPGWVCLTCCNADILFSALVIQWITSHDSTGAHDSSPPSDKVQSYQPTNTLPPPPAPPRPPRRGRGQKKLNISLPLKTTSTSQYEHIFGDIEAEADITSASSAFTSLKKSGTATPRFDYDICGNEGDDERPNDNSILQEQEQANEVNEQSDTTNATTLNDKPNNRTPDPSTRTLTSPPSTHLSPSPLPHSHPQPPSQTQTQPSTPTTKPHPSPASAAVAADLERLRRYRGRLQQQHQRANPTSKAASPSLSTKPATGPTGALIKPPLLAPDTSAMTRKSSARDPGHAYRISPLVFEGGSSDSRWLDLVDVEVEVGKGGKGGDLGAGGWI
ncbi:uncharacterized protein F4822DRAFT_429383 [Hypoxylon trugodes]|uniref:uncharacterized protein n=1 Tax=Hypoxylon trugodes TaxID=326681 RepID=UPI0021A20395|nr:uncharacterized protein F4822DRAFT_429383 [Hypoxylon trugodes]KAI1388768.1 hypothetical protein F4822DRAFT_429383 [Hypoxylon trugodes]